MPTSSVQDKKAWYVYMLFCDQKIFYVGIANNVEERLAKHKNKESFFTSKFSDIDLVFCERYNTKKQAALREKQIKGWTRAKKLLLVEGKLGINACTKIGDALRK